MHLAVKPDTVDHLPLISFERATEIVQANSGNRGDQPISQDARNVTLKHIILTIFPPTRNNVESLFQKVEHPRDISRIVLTVPIHWNDHVPLSEIEACHHRGSLAGVPLEMDYPNAPVLICQAIQNLGRSVGAPIIDKDNLPASPQLGKLPSHPLAQVDQTLGLVVDRNNNRYQHRRQLPVRTPKVNTGKTYFPSVEADLVFRNFPLGRHSAYGDRAL
jgi:hypothetical protein